MSTVLELGKVCALLSKNEVTEQVWILKDNKSSYPFCYINFNWQNTDSLITSLYEADFLILSIFTLGCFLASHILNYDFLNKEKNL